MISAQDLEVWDTLMKTVETNTPRPGESVEQISTRLNRGHDPVNHPKHYTAHPSGIECIEVTEWMNFNLGNAVKYIWRAGEKGNLVEDLRKAAWYLNREIERMTKARAS